MCFVKSYRFFKPKIRVARSDIICYKYLLFKIDDPTVICAPFYKIKSYKMRGSNEKIELEVEINVTDHSFFEKRSAVIDKGYHSYIELEVCERILNLYDTFDFGMNVCAAKCIIPKGSKYYKNDKEYVSENIIVLNRIQKTDL